MTTSKICCMICGEQTHAIKIHLNAGAHPDMTLEKYQSIYRDAPIYSEHAIAVMAQKKIDLRQKEKTEQLNMTASSVVSIMSHLKPEKVAMNKVFDLKRSKAALSSSGNEIMIERAHRTGEYVDLIPEIDENYIYPIDLLKNVLMGLEENIPTLLWGHAGCHAAGTGVLMSDGLIKNVEDVMVGDRLASPTETSNCRTVLGLARGNEQMYRITPVKGESFVVNENHILSLKTTNGPANGIVGGQIENITVKDYLEKSKYWKSYRKLWRGEYVGGNDGLFDPYLVGVMLGDGSISGNWNSCPSITSMDNEVLGYFKQSAEDLGCNVKEYLKPNNKASQFFAQFNGGHKNPLRDKLIEVGIWGMICEEKAVPAIYKQAGKQTRLSILAGLLDTDGHLNRGHNFDFISRSKQLSADVQFLARSVGLSATLKECKKGCQNGFVGTYWRVCVSGDISKIPTLKGVNVSKRGQIKNPLVTGFKLESVGNDNFYGFCLDGDHLYMTSDFIVHHNTGKSSMYEQVCARTNRPYMRVQHTANTEESHIIGQILANKDGTYFEPGPLTLAMKHGFVYNADEYDFAHASILGVYQPVLEGKPLLIKEAPVEWRVVKPHKNFRFVATGNTNGSGDEAGLYAGTNIGNSANYSRFGITDHVKYMPKKQEAAVIAAQGDIDIEDAKLLVEFATKIRTAFDSSQMSATIGPRELIYAAKLGLRKGSWKRGVELAFINRMGTVDMEVASGIAQRIFAEVSETSAREFEDIPL